MLQLFWLTSLPALLLGGSQRHYPACFCAPCLLSSSGGAPSHLACCLKVQVSSTHHTIMQYTTRLKTHVYPLCTSFWCRLHLKCHPIIHLLSCWNNVFEKCSSIGTTNIFSSHSCTSGMVRVAHKAFWAFTLFVVGAWGVLGDNGRRELFFLPFGPIQQTDHSTGSAWDPGEWATVHLRHLFQALESSG